MSEFQYIVYCDGASRKDGRGGWGFAVYRGKRELFCDFGGGYNTTNNRMELTGAIQALQRLPLGAVIKVVSDSQYVVKGITEYVDFWLLNNWRTAGNKEVKNIDLWETLAHLDVDRLVAWEWVKGHTGHIGNERADRLAAMGVPGESNAARNQDSVGGQRHTLTDVRRQPVSHYRKRSRATGGT